MKNEDLVFIIFYAICSLIVFIYGLIDVIKGYKNKDKEDFKNGLLWTLISFLPASMIIVPICLIFILIAAITQIGDNLIDKILKKK